MVGHSASFPVQVRLVFVEPVFSFLLPLFSGSELTFCGRGVSPPQVRYVFLMEKILTLLEEREYLFIVFNEAGGFIETDFVTDSNPLFFGPMRGATITVT